MAPSVEVRPLRREDDRSGFCCGQPDLDRFFHHYAGQNQFRLRVSVTYVAVVGDTILGFATVAPGSLERRSLPQKKLRRRLPAYPLPILRLARLGVDRRAQGSGVGAALVGHVLQLAIRQRDALGCVGVLTDAKPDAVAFYRRLGFEELHGVAEGMLHGEPTPMFLPIETVAAAGG